MENEQVKTNETQKKVYVAPEVKVIDLRAKNNLLQDSGCAGGDCFEGEMD